MSSGHSPSLPSVSSLTWLPVTTFLLGFLAGLWTLHICQDDLLRRIQITLQLVFPRTPRWLSSKESTCQSRRCRRRRFDPLVRKILWRRKGQPTPVFMPGESNGQRSLVATVHGVAKSWTRLSSQHFQFTFYLYLSIHYLEGQLPVMSVLDLHVELW